MYVAGNFKQLKTQHSSYALRLPHNSIKVSPTGPKLIMNSLYSSVPNNILTSFHDYAFN